MHEPPDPPAPPFGPRRFALVLAAALAASSGAFWLSLQRHLPRDASFGSDALAGLAGRLTEVDRIRVAGSDGTGVTLSRVAGRFVVAERDGFAADGPRVHALLAALADLKIAEHHRVPPADWIGANGATRIELGGRLPALVVTLGRPVGPENAYLRVGEAVEVLEVGPAPRVSTQATYWIRQRLLDIAPAEVRRLEYGAVAAPLTLERAGPDRAFEWRGRGHQGPPPAALAGAEPTLARALDISDVRRAAGPGGCAALTALETRAGLRVELCARGVSGERHWLGLSARHVPATDASLQESDRAREAAATIAAATTGFEFDIPRARYAEIFPTAPER